MWNTFCPTLFGTGASKETGAQAKMLGMNKVMVCTEKALCDFGVATQVVDALQQAGLEVLVFDKCKADAPSDICDEGAAFVRKHGIDGIVAVGGGSTLDTAKAIGIIISQNGTTIRDYYGIGEAEHAMKLITLSTTSGTGSEISQWAVIGDVETGAKEMPVYKPDLAIVDPVLTYSLPAGPTAATGMDVLAHCVEAITNRNYNPYGYIFGKEGIRLTMKWLPIAVKEPNNVEAREKMSLAANLGGMGDLCLRLPDRTQLQPDVRRAPSHPAWSRLCLGFAGCDGIHRTIWRAQQPGRGRGRDGCIVHGGDRFHAAGGTAGKACYRFDERTWYQIAEGFRLYAGGLPCFYRAVFP